MLPADVGDEGAAEVGEPLPGQGVEEPPIAEEEGEDLLMHLQRTEAFLFQGRAQGPPPVDQPLGRLLHLGAELREDLDLQELRVVQLQLGRDFFEGGDLRLPADARDRFADVDGGEEPLVEELPVEIDLPVGDGGINPYLLKWLILNRLNLLLLCHQ